MVNSFLRHHNTTPDQSDGDQGDADRHHGPEAKEDRRDRRTLVARKILEARKAAVPLVRQDQAAEMRDGDLGAIPLVGLVGKREQHQVRGAVVIPVGLDRRDLRRLVLQRVESVLIAKQQLQRTQDREHADAHPHHGAAFGLELVANQVARARRQHDDRRRQVGGGHHVGEPEGEAWIEDHPEPVTGKATPSCRT